MNHAYRLIWNQVYQSWVAVSEVARGRSKGSGRKLVMAALSLSAVGAHAAPGGGQVVSGSGSISRNGATTTITQSSSTLSVNWNSFNIAPKETVTFVQPTASSIAVNRIFDTSGTRILGKLNANGQVFLINPNGILFGKGAQVNVGGLVASTLDVNDASLGSGKLSFSGNGTGSVINQGAITAANGGYVALLGNHVGNEGTIVAKLGTVALGAGSAVTLTFGGSSLVSMQVDQSTLNNLAENGGLIQADGGIVLMTAGAKDALLASVVNSTGVIEARTVENHDGKITLLGGMAAGQVNVGGTLDASAPNGGNGGSIETSAATVKVAPDATITTRAPDGLTGSWLIDPTDFTVAASGGDMTGAALSTALNNNSVQLQSTSGGSAGSGNINIDDTVSWGAATTLTLTALANININQSITATNANGKLALQYGMGAVNAGNTATYNVNAPVNLQAGNNFSTQLGSNGAVTQFKVITSLGNAGSTTGTDLQGVNGNLGGNFVLGANIDASATSGWNSGQGFVPIGSYISPFTGVFDGLGHTISNLTIARPNDMYIGLFGQVGAPNGAGVVTGSVIRNVGLVNGSIVGESYVGGLVGQNYGTISHSYATANVATSGGPSGGGVIGGLVGANGTYSYKTGSIDNSYAGGTVGGGNGFTSDVGGLAGLNYGTITNSHALGAVSSPGFNIGGLVGINAGTISRSFATGNVNIDAADDEASNVGGLVGFNGSQSFGGGSGPTSTISESYAIGNVGSAQASDMGFVGGLVGYNYSSLSSGATVTNSFALGSVTGAAYVGGLVGGNSGATISNSYAAGRVTGGSDSGGITSTSSSLPPGLITNSYWNTTTTGLTSSATASGGGGLTSTQARSQSSFASWDFPNTWEMGSNGPILTRLATVVTVTPTASSSNVTYNGSAYSGGFTYTSSFGGSPLSGTATYAGAATQSATNAGNYAITMSGLSTIDPEFTIVYASGTLTINPKAVTVTGTSASGKVYDGTTTAQVSGGTVSGLIGADAGTVVLTQSGTFVSPNAGTNVGVTMTDALSGTGASNYVITQPTGVTATITPATVTVTGTTVGDKVYDSTTAATVSGGAISGLIGADAGTVTLTQSGTFASKDVGTGIGVTLSGLLSGTNASNYVVVEQTGLTANITPATLTVTGASANNKVYDGTTDATFTGGTLVGVLGSDSVSLTQSGTFASKNVGTGIGVTAADTLAGTDAGNYVIVQPTSFSANITPATLTVTGTSASDKVYDGTTTATLTGGTLSGLFGSDSVTLTQSGTFASKNVGTGIGVTAADSLGGTDASNYVIAQPTSLSANITPATLTVTGTTTASDKVYDGTTSATLSGGTLSGLIGLDSVTLTQSGTFASKNVGTGISVTAADSLGGTDAGNYVIAQPTGVLSANITPATLTVTGTSANNKVYDGTTTATLTGGTLSGLIGSDSVTLTQSGTFASKNVGNGIGVTAADSLAGTDAGNYVITQPTFLSADITPATLTVTGTSASNKVYDGTTAATLSGGTLSGLFGSDSVTLTESGTFASKNVGNGIGVTATDALAGTDAGNYVIAQPTSLSANITPATLTVTGTSASNKVYDGTTAATLSGGTLSGLIGSDSVTLTQSGTFASKNVGTGIGVTAADSLGGTDAGNYVIAQPTGVTADITPATLTVTGTSASNKVYDGTTTATLSGGTLSGLIGSDSVTLTQAGTFATKNVGAGIDITASDALTGTDAGNYVIAQPTSLSANITPATLTVTGSSASNKVYDGTTAATLSGGTLSGVIGSDSVTLTQSGTFASKNVGNGIGVTAADTLGGGDAGNYVLTQPTGALSADITPATLTVTGTSASNKVYDGTTAATLSGGTLSGLIGSDSVTLTQAGTFASKNAGNGISVNTADTLAGTDAGNYVIAQPTGVTADITPATLTVTGTSASNKVYDGTTSATLSGGTLSGLIGSDSVTLTQSGTFASKNVGNGIDITASDALTGTDAGNYVIAQPTSLSANITPASLTVTGTSANNKVYDGTTTATLSGGTLTGLFGSDSVTLTQSGTFASKNVGNGIGVTAVDTLSGTDAGNYVLTQPTAALSADITPATLTVTGTSANNKVYDGTTAATLSGGTLSGLIGSDSVTLTQSGTFASKNAGSGISVNTADTLGGADAGNYVIAQPTSVTADITPATLTVTGTSASNKVYDGTTAATLSGGTLSGLIGSDSVTLTQSGTFATKNVGNGIGITASDALTGADAGNYVIAQPTSLSANITPATLTYTAAPASGQSGRPLPDLSGTVSGFVGGDTLANSTSGTLTWTTSANSSSGAGSYAIDGAGLTAANYVFTDAPGNAGALTITAAPLNTLPNILASVQTSFFGMGGTAPGLNTSSTISALPASNAPGTPNNAGSTTQASSSTPIPTVTLSIGGTGTLNIQSLGVNLPSDTLIGKN
ncbi:beta strand repeat-containing protein [Paraburkholderia sp. ZP32-5]|uniref:beta strand repeat-containing protein n=1 Tax=Paraburkholderia sp. ZP32-5 TaxID=2883245 RepID=UPI001F341146|nr:YDG domain-containing protein [Paraburkholderia sp. ZP32-5]